MSPDVHRKGVLKRVLTTRAARYVSLVMVVALVGSLFAGLVSLSSYGVSPAYATPSELAKVQSDLKKAKAALAKKQASLDALAVAENKAESQLAVTQDKITSVQAKIEAANKKLADLAAKLEVRLRDIYMNRGSDAIAFIDALFAGNGSFDQVMKELSLLSRVANSDRKLIADVKSNSEDLRDLRADLAGKRKQEQKDNTELAKAMDAQTQALEASRNSYNDLRAQVKALELEEAKHQQEIAAYNATSTTKSQSNGNTGTSKGQTGTTKKGTATTKGNTGTTKKSTATTNKPDPPIVGGDFVFPVAGPNSFTDTWGAPRSGGRTHKGCDIMTARGTPLVACVTGSIMRTNPADTGLGGITVWVRGSNGNTYYYAHCSSIKAGIKAGVKVKAGQTIAYAGNTGNARGGAVHLHFEIHPHGGAAVDPYPTLIKYR